MDPREIVRGNGYPAPVSLSIDVPWSALPSTNLGVFTSQTFSVHLDPQLDVSHTSSGIWGDDMIAKRRFRRKALSALMGEFAVWNDELLRELAR